MLTAEEKRALNDAAAALYYISTDDNGIHHIDLYADYSDTNEGLLQLAYNHRMDNREQTIPDEGEGAGKKSGRWIAQITFKGKTRYLGSYATIEEATRARRKAEERYFGECLEQYADLLSDAKETSRK